MKPVTDRELLELAAKVADLPYKWNEYWHGMYRQRTDGEWEPYEWDPLNNDGDAMRLMVALKLEPRFIDNSGTVENSRVVFHNISGVVVDWGDDLLAATRRAIVRAAAEIGRDTPAPQTDAEALLALRERLGEKP